MSWKTVCSDTHMMEVSGGSIYKYASYNNGIAMCFAPNPPEKEIVYIGEEEKIAELKAQNEQLMQQVEALKEIVTAKEIEIRRVDSFAKNKIKRLEGDCAYVNMQHAFTLNKLSLANATLARQGVSIAEDEGGKLSVVDDKRGFLSIFKGK